MENCFKIKWKNIKYEGNNRGKEKKKCRWLSRYPLAYVQHNTFNTGLVTLKDLIEATVNKIDKIAEITIALIISQRGREVERVT